jgi:hypothetical protein
MTRFSRVEDLRVSIFFIIVSHHSRSGIPPLRRCEFHITQPVFICCWSSIHQRRLRGQPWHGPRPLVPRFVYKIVLMVFLCVRLVASEDRQNGATISKKRGHGGCAAWRAWKRVAILGSPIVIWGNLRIPRRHGFPPKPWLPVHPPYRTML